MASGQELGPTLGRYVGVRGGEPSDHLVFLDFDGVMHPEGGAALSGKPFCRRQVLEGWLRQHPEVAIVISSSWRVVHSMGEMQDLLGDVVGSQVVGRTPEFKDLEQSAVPEDLHGHKREAEIRAWLREHARPWTRWVALDDSPWFFKPFCPYLVVCNHAVGLTEDDLARAWSLLRL